SAHPIQRWVGMFSLRLFQASGYSKVKQGAIQVPGCYWPQVEAVQAVYFPEANQGEWEWHSPTIYYFRRRLLFLGILPAVAGIGLSLLSQNQHMIPLFILWAPAA
ncbi:hypothetical protein RZS08_53620, partial [Arthrospira platensis SPKY1]|nr:hypothetical protein [Arthrospira platensis SPKY1]